MPGYLGLESARGPDGVGITVFYWTSEDAIANWKRHGAATNRDGRSARAL
jgi:heme-degrading monooxygenase HmoA